LLAAVFFTCSLILGRERVELLGVFDASRKVAECPVSLCFGVEYKGLFLLNGANDPLIIAGDLCRRVDTLYAEKDYFNTEARLIGGTLNVFCQDLLGLRPASPKLTILQGGLIVNLDSGACGKLCQLAVTHRLKPFLRVVVVIKEGVKVLDLVLDRDIGLEQADGRGALGAFFSALAAGNEHTVLFLIVVFAPKQRLTDNLAGSGVNLRHKPDV
jgi:hypothetical protein